MVTTAEERPIDPTPVHTADLPPTPTRDRNIPATAWIEAPAGILDSGDDPPQPEALYKRRIGPWLLWRSGPARGDHARYVALTMPRFLLRLPHGPETLPVKKFNHQ